MTQVDTFGAYVRAELEHWGRESELNRRLADATLAKKNQMRREGK